jgi:hypothetical protein
MACSNCLDNWAIPVAVSMWVEFGILPSRCGKDGACNVGMEKLVAPSASNGGTGSRIDSCTGDGVRPIIVDDGE